LNWDYKPFPGPITILQLLIALGILLSAFVITFLAKRYLRRSLKEKINKDQMQLLFKIINYGAFGSAILLVIIQLGLGKHLSGLVVAGGVVGIVLGFASQNVVSNFISGVFIMIERPIKIGNSVNINGTIGIVEEIRIMSTIVRTFDGLYVRIPNISVFTNTLINYVANAARRVDYVVGIRYSDDADKAIKLIRGFLAEEPLVLANPEPNVFVDHLGDSSVNLFVRYWAPVEEWWDLKMSLLLRIKKLIEANGIEIPFPQRVVWFAEKDGEKVEVPLTEAEPAEETEEPGTQ